jgi:hypothetical protein|tara:strand:+ start:335 stop:547 length:213 start_codon:yes stop_codon:yes gene_type:complete
MIKLKEILKEKQINMRDTFYQIGDAIENLNWLTKRHATFSNDKKLKDHVNRLYKTHDILRKYLDKNYEWD